MTECPFCAVREDTILVDSCAGIAFLDNYPISNGHCLIVPTRHVDSIFDLEPVELSGLWALLALTRTELQLRYHPAGFNIGINDGRAAGQTVRHAHIHVIPRYAGDVEDPRGGVRWVIPNKAQYW